MKRVMELLKCDNTRENQYYRNNPTNLEVNRKNTILLIPDIEKLPKIQSMMRKSLESPVIIEDMSDLDISNLQKRQNSKSDQNVSKELNTAQDTEGTSIVVAESINPNSTSNTSRNNKKHEKLTPSMYRRRSLPISADSKKAKILTPSPSTQKERQDTEWDEFKADNGNWGLQQIDAPTKYSPSSEKLRFYCLHNKVLVLMQEKSNFCFTGKVVLKVLYGAVEVYGFRITTSSPPLEIYSPRGYSLISIEASYSFPESNVQDIWIALAEDGVDLSTEDPLKFYINECKPGTAVITLLNLENRLTSFLNTYFPIKLFPKIGNTKSYSWTDIKRAEVILQSNLYLNDPCKQITIDSNIVTSLVEKMLSRWQEGNWCCTLVAGGKGVGKSTTIRYLINNLLATSRRVILVDIDPGQSECTPPGCVSYSLIEEPLMGPNFTHLKTPVYQLYIGDINVSRCITRYIEGIKMLADKLFNCPIMSRLPVVINTMGFTQGIGWNIIVLTIKLFKPSFVLQIMSERPRNNFSNFLGTDVIDKQKSAGFSWSKDIVDWRAPCCHELVIMQSQAEQKHELMNEGCNMQPYQQRELSMISYLSGIVSDNEFSTKLNRGPAPSINEAVPYVAPFSSLTIALPQECVPPSHALTVINGNIVALCGIDLNGNMLRETNQSNPRVLTRAPLCACYGFGIIRGVDEAEEKIYVNTSVPMSLMQYVNCLIGCIPVPLTLLQLNQRNAPYVGGSNALPTSRDPRRGYFRMRYKQNANN